MEKSLNSPPTMSENCSIPQNFAKSPTKKGIFSRLSVQWSHLQYSVWLRTLRNITILKAAMTNSSHWQPKSLMETWLKRFCLSKPGKKIISWLERKLTQPIIVSTWSSPYVSKYDQKLIKKRNKKQKKQNDEQKCWK